ncbi:protein transport protein HofC [Gilliamella sp. ESL0250]|uniref:protein transport protein HofC n=1 Tax=Gilliamella sp. ESL0250 TaxID=2705036 RepID=UPI0015808AD0|nr:protein transport protein HofC [Gilliamella sp. ESL0250]NUF49758.1 protein transport protein HofC [Gilliamella sp. ESL0250]
MKRLYYWYDLDFNQHKIIAKSSQAVKRQLLSQGKIAIKIKAGNIITAHSFNRADLLIITKQLATMLKAGLSIIDTLQLLAQEQTKPHWQYLLLDIKQQIAKGEFLSQVLQQHHSVFSVLYCEIIATGELTGQLDESFAQLALLLEKSINLQKSLKKAMRYPLFLLSVAMIVSLVMLLFVLPKFSDIYQDFDAELPAFTQSVIDFSNYLQQSWLIWCTVFFIGYFGYQRYFKVRYRREIEAIVIKCPLMGKVIQTSCLTQIFQTIAITQKAGIPLLTGLAAAGNTTYYSLYRDSISQIIAGIEQGHSFSHVLHQQLHFPNLCSQLIHVGEQSGTLDLMLDKLATYYQEQNQTLTDNLSQAFEPLLMLILALIIGCLIVAMYLPIFQMGEVIH